MGERRECHRQRAARDETLCDVEERGSEPRSGDSRGS